MRLLLAFLGAAALAAVGWVCWRATAETRDWRELLALGAKSKRNVAEEASFKTLARRHLPEECPAYVPWKVALHEVPDGSRRILAFFKWPGGSPDLHLHLLNENYRRLSSTTLQAGFHGCGLRLKAAPRPDLSTWTFEIESASPGGCTFHYYAVMGDRPVLVRVEGESGRLLRNDYTNRDAVLGPPLPVDALERCERGLSSGRLPEVLEALVWLGGRHSNPSAWHEVRRRPGVVNKLSELTRSAVPWIAEAAAQVLNIEGPRVDLRRPGTP